MHMSHKFLLKLFPTHSHILATKPHHPLIFPKPLTQGLHDPWHSPSPFLLTGLYVPPSILHVTKQLPLDKRGQELNIILPCHHIGDLRDFCNTGIAVSIITEWKIVISTIIMISDLHFTLEDCRSSQMFLPCRKCFCRSQSPERQSSSSRT